MSDPVSNQIQATHYDGAARTVPDNYTIKEHNGFTTLWTTDRDDVVELIWHDDGTLTIVVNGEHAIWVDDVKAGKVFIHTEGGDDTIFVTGNTPEGNELILHGGDGSDVIIGSDGKEQIEGGDGIDYLWGMGGDDKLYGAWSDDSKDRDVDYLHGGAGNDELHGKGSDELHGNAGEDIFSGGIHFGNSADINPDLSGSEYIESDEDYVAPPSSDELTELTSNADNVRYQIGPTNSDIPPDAEPAEPDPSADTAPDLGPGAPPDDLPTAEPPIGNENMEVPEEPPVPSGVSAEEQPQLIFDQLDDFYKSTIEDLASASESCLAQAQLAADAGDMDAATAWAAKADWYASQAERLSAAAEVRFGIAVRPEDADSIDGLFDSAWETVEDCEALAVEARAYADEAERIAEGVEPEEPAEPATEVPSDTEEAPVPPLPSTLPGGDTAAGQLFHFHDQLTGFYAKEIEQALDKAQTYAENAIIAADSGDTEGAERWARLALEQSARADELLQDAQARLGGAERQLDEVLNDPDATEAEKELAQQQYDEAKLAVETAETQAAEAADLAEEARVAAGLPEGDDGSVPSADDATTEPGAEGSESEPEGATPGAEGSEPGADGEEPGGEGTEAPGAAGGAESSDDPYNEAMDNASQGTAQTEADRRTRGRSGNFLLAMAEAMGLMQAKFLGDAMKSLDTMDSLSSVEIPEGDADAERQHREAFLVAQSMFQADMQMFNIVSQASATALRSTGEGMAAVVRKN